ncbi:MAG: hypothetical protein AAB558_01090 [Patescibacteria group bacterium]
MTPEQLIKMKTQLQTEVEEWEKKLHGVIQKQKEEKHAEKLAQLILQYDQIEREIEDRSHVFSVLSQPEEALNSPYIKSEWYSYIEAAETASPELVDAVMDRFAVAIRQSITSGEDDTVDLIQAEYKEYLFLGQILSGHFERVDGLVMEMNAAILKLDPAYDAKQSSAAVFYAFQKAIDSNVRIEPIAEAVKAGTVKNLTVDQRNQLLDKLEERAAVLRFEITRKQNVAMEKAVERLESQEK